MSDRTEPLISVIIPVYNVEHYVTRCLLSIMDNTYSNLEIICVDDGSTDESGHICDRFALEDSRITVIHKTNGGLSSARNEGMQKATGDYIAFIDSDDWVHQSYFAILIHSMLENNTDMAMCDYERAGDDFVFKKEDPSYEVRIISAMEMMSAHDTKSYVWRRIYRKSLIEGIDFDRTVKIEDALFNTRVIADNPDYRISYIPLKLYAYYLREQSLITFLRAEDSLVLGENMYRITKDTKQESLRSFLATESVKRLLSARIEFDVLKKKEKSRECSSLMSELVEMISGRKNRLKYSLLVKIPLSYHMFRIIDDPTMLTYFKQLKVKEANTL